MSVPQKKPSELVLRVSDNSCELRITGYLLKALMAGDVSIKIRKDSGEIISEAIKDLRVGFAAVKQTVPDRPVSITEAPAAAGSYLAALTSSPYASSTSGKKEEKVLAPSFKAKEVDGARGKYPKVLRASPPPKSKKTGERVSQPGKAKKGSSPPPTKDEIVKSRMVRLGRYDDSNSFEENFKVLPSQLQKCLSLPSKLWKEYAISNHLTGYEAACANRQRALRDEPDHSDRVKANASRKGGKCLRQGTQSKTPQGKSEEESSTQVEEKETAGVSSNSGEETAKDSVS